MTTQWALSDKAIEDHIKQKTTIGIFAGEFITKFLTFDVDGKKYADVMTLELVNTLVYEFDIDFNNILVTFSGNKGYHVTIFFDEVTEVNLLKRFYFIVLQRLEYKRTEIEFRATNTQAVKLPFSVHRKTGKKCYIVNNRTLEKSDISTFKNIQQVNKKIFVKWFNSSFSADDILAAEKDVEYFEDRDNCLEEGQEILLTQSEVNQYKKIKSELNFSKGITNESKMTTIKNVLANNKLLYTNSRNQMTYYISIYLRDTGYDIESAKSIIKNVMMNTFKENPKLIESSLEYTISEVDKVTENTYKKGYTLMISNHKTVYVYEDEILDVLDLKNMTLMKLYLSHLVHAKRYAKDDKYYMSYSVMTRMGNTKSRLRLKQHMQKLEKEGRIKFVSKNFHETTRYEQIKKFDQVGANYKIDVSTEELDLQSILLNLVDKKTLRSKLSRYLYNQLVS